MGRDQKSEMKRRRVEVWSLLPLGFILIFLNWALFRFYSGQSFPLSHAIFFFGLVNLNVLVFLGILFFLGRNLVKIYAEAKPRRWGRTLKTKLFLAFVSFAFIPTSLMFLVSIFYINNSFDRWFTNQTQDVLKHSSSLTNHYIADVKFNAFFIANRITSRYSSKEFSKSFISEKVKDYGVDAIEFYNVENKTYESAVFSEKSGFYLPQLEWKSLETDVANDQARSLTRKTEQGEWLSAMVISADKKGILIVSKILPFTLVDTINAVIASRTDYQKAKEFKIPLKSTYIFILVTMTLVILAFGGWFSLYLAESLSKSFEALGMATKKISQGVFSPIKFKTGMDEVNGLIANFNLMTSELEVAKSDLDKSVGALKEHSIYMDTVLSQVSSGVVSCDEKFKISFTNKRVEKLFKVKNKNLLGKSFDSIFPAEISSLVRSFRGGEDESSIHEVDVDLGKKEKVSLQVTVSCLLGGEGEKIGRVITMEKVDLLRENQRVKAWKEVATRVAHEIKNPLTPVKLSAERLQKKFSSKVSDPIFDQCITTILSHVDLIKDLVNEFNRFARFPKLKPEKVSLETLIGELIESFETSHPSVKFDLKVKDSVSLYLDRGQMKRVFINLIDNSIEAMKSLLNKSIYIEVSNSESGRVAWVKFYDSGPGVSKENWKNIFKSQYTTKKVDGGLGLSIVKKIIDDHGGRVSLLRGEKSSSLFLIELPLRKV